MGCPLRPSFDRWRRKRWLKESWIELGKYLLNRLSGLVISTGPDAGEAALAVTVWTVVGLAGDFLLIPLLERVRGLSYLRVSAVVELVLFTALLLVPYVWAKYVLLGLLGLFNAGWYSILKGRLYSSMPGQSGTVMAVGNVFGFVGGLIPIALGRVAEGFGLGVMMWLLLLGPVALLVGLPRNGQAASGAGNS